VPAADGIEGSITKTLHKLPKRPGSRVKQFLKPTQRDSLVHQVKHVLLQVDVYSLKVSIPAGLSQAQAQGRYGTWICKRTVFPPYLLQSKASPRLGTYPKDIFKIVFKSSASCHASRMLPVVPYMLPRFCARQ